MIWILTIVFSVSIFMAAMAARSYLLGSERRREDAVRRRLERLREIPTGVEGEAQPRVLLKDSSLSSIPALNRLLGRTPRNSVLTRILIQAGKPCNLGTLVLTSTTLLGVGILAGMATGQVQLGPLVGLLLCLAPWGWLLMLRKRRLAAFSEQFPEAVDLMARALRAGHSFGSAIQMIGGEIEDPAAEEFTRVFDDYSFGKTLEDSLAGLVERIGTEEVKFFVTAVNLQRETGGNLTEILDNISHIVRERFRLQRQVRAISAEGRLSGTILSLIAPTLLGALVLTSESYVSTLFNHPTGRLMLVSGGVLQLLGILVIKKLVHIKV